MAVAGVAGGNRSLVALAASRLVHQSLLCFIDSACGLVGCAVEMIRGWDGSHGREHIGGDLLIFEELLMARVTIRHVNLQKVPILPRRLHRSGREHIGQRTLRGIEDSQGAASLWVFVPILSLTCAFGERHRIGAARGLDSSGV